MITWLEKSCLSGLRTVYVYRESLLICLRVSSFRFRGWDVLIDCISS